MKPCGKRESIGTDKVVSYQYRKAQGNWYSKPFLFILSRV
jgi:hypothetical protein